MKKHILSIFNNENFKVRFSGTLDKEKSVVTSNSDYYGLKSYDPTVLTEEIENSDPDEFVSYTDPTRITFTIESTDEDSFTPFFS